MSSGVAIRALFRLALLIAAIVAVYTGSRSLLWGLEGAKHFGTPSTIDAPRQKVG